MAEKTPKGSVGKAASKFEKDAVLKSPLSVIKMDVSQLRDYADRLNEFIADPGLAAIRICECCIQIT